MKINKKAVSLFLILCLPLLLSASEFTVKVVEAGKDLPRNFYKDWKKGDLFISDGQFLMLVGGASRQSHTKVNNDAGSVLGSVLAFAPQTKNIKDSLVIGAPLVPHMIGSWTGTMTNRLFLNSMVGLNATGIYSVGYNFGAVQTLVQDAFHQAWIPSLFEKLKKGDHDDKREIVKISYLYFFISLAMAFIVAKLSAVIIPFFVGAEFAEASKYVLWIALGFSADGMGKMVVGYLYFQKKTYWLATISVVSGAIGLPITYILIKQNGPIGAAQSFTIVFFLKFLLTWFASMRVLPMPWALSRLAPDPSAG